MGATLPRQPQRALERAQAAARRLSVRLPPRLPPRRLPRLPSRERERHRAHALANFLKPRLRRERKAYRRECAGNIGPSGHRCAHRVEGQDGGVRRLVCLGDQPPHPPPASQGEERSCHEQRNTQRRRKDLDHTRVNEHRKPQPHQRQPCEHACAEARARQCGVASEFRLRLRARGYGACLDHRGQRRTSAVRQPGGHGKLWGNPSGRAVVSGLAPADGNERIARR